VEPKALDKSGWRSILLGPVVFLFATLDGCAESGHFAELKMRTEFVVLA